MKFQFLIPHSSFLIQKKNLLAFSAGIDSSALFFLLLENNIKFDIAIVDYGARAQSKVEVAHAKALAKEHKLYCHTITAPKFEANFEKQARDFRYAFFESLIASEGYDTLLTAHQLNDQLEWFLMRLSKGAGVSELVGMEPVVQKDGYTLIRPLLEYTKADLLAYLKSHSHPYFVDESNADAKYERNHFRKTFADPLLAAYSEGIRRSFTYLREEKRRLESDFEMITKIQLLRILKLHTPKAKTKAADVTLKQLGYLLSAAQRKEIANKDSLVIGRKWAVTYQEGLLYIAPYLCTNMPKDFKERCRVNKIPPKIRPYLFEAKIDLKQIYQSISVGCCPPTTPKHQIQNRP